MQLELQRYRTTHNKDIFCLNYMNRGGIESAYCEVEEDLKVYVIACTGKDMRDMSLDCSLRV